MTQAKLASDKAQAPYLWKVIPYIYPAEIRTEVELIHGKKRTTSTELVSLAFVNKNKTQEVLILSAPMQIRVIGGYRNTWLQVSKTMPANMERAQDGTSTRKEIIERFKRHANYLTAKEKAKKKNKKAKKAKAGVQINTKKVLVYGSLKHPGSLVVLRNFVIDGFVAFNNFAGDYTRLGSYDPFNEDHNQLGSAKWSLTIIGKDPTNADITDDIPYKDGYSEHAIDMARCNDGFEMMFSDQSLPYYSLFRQKDDDDDLKDVPTMPKPNDGKRDDGMYCDSQRG